MKLDTLVQLAGQVGHGELDKLDRVGHGVLSNSLDTLFLDETE